MFAIEYDFNSPYGNFGIDFPSRDFGDETEIPAVGDKVCFVLFESAANLRRADNLNAGFCEIVTVTGYTDIGRGDQPRRLYSTTYGEKFR